MRSVILKPTPRCGGCQLPPRWCTCAALEPVRCPLGIDLLIHSREQFRPSSTGNLISRVFPEARRHVWSQHVKPAAADVVTPGRDTWILHPHGGPPPPGLAAAQVQVVLLDGAWHETSDMARAVAGWGRLVSLPLEGTSRFWLRAKQEGRRFSTAEALLHLLDVFGLEAARDALRLQFDLHVYAHLRARGRLEPAADFLKDSVLPTRCPETIARLQARRPNEAATPAAR
jgi:hypothetical protein